MSEKERKTTIYDELINTFKENKYQIDVNNNVFIEKVIDDVMHQREEVMKLILGKAILKNVFFKKIADAFVFNPKALIEVLSAENKYLESRTTYSQSIGLTKKDDFIKMNDDVVLSFPFKDTVFVGGQDKEDEKTNENFLQEIINSNEIVRLFEPKVMTNIKRYSKDKVESNPIVTKDDNLIIKGNNLLALHSLLDKANGEALYRGKVKLIYIDPPYNTGSDSFNYNDNFSHSTWLTFMKNRLEVAREFLSDDGVIYVSLDDKEIHYLKVLLDEIFGRENFVGNIAWESKTKSQNTKTSFNKLQPKVEHILLYTKKTCRRFNLIKKGEKQYPNNDKNGKYREYILEVMDSEGTRGRTSMVFEIEGILPPHGRQWKLGQESIIEYKNRNDLFVRNGKIILKIRPEDEKNDLTEPFWGLLTKDIGTAESAKKELTEILGTSKHGFETVKPVSLIKRLVFHATNKGDIVMDFFAGSGTTAHAVLDTNNEQEKELKFILIEQMNYIEDITIPRIKKVIEKNKQGSFVYMELKELDEYKDTELESEMRYLPIEEIEDEAYNISKEEQESNFAFYGIETKRD